MAFNPLQAIFGGAGAGFADLQPPGLQDPSGARKEIPEELRQFFSGVQQHGFLGEGGAGRVANQALQGANLRNRSLSRGLRRRVSRRLGPRSGAADTVIANKVNAPAFGGIADLLANLQVQNQQSKLQGASGQFDVLRFLEDRFNTRQQAEADQPGALDYVGPVADIAGLFI